MASTRQAYHIKLDELGNTAARMCQLAGDALRDATGALLEANLALAEKVIGIDAELDAMRASTESSAIELLALQAPVAKDLRAVLSALWIVADLQRMGALAIHVARAARRRHPARAIPIAVRPLIERMGTVGVHLAEMAEIVLRERNVELARTLEIQDDLMDDLQQQLFTALHAPTWTAGAGPAVDMALLGRASTSGSPTTPWPSPVDWSSWSPERTSAAPTSRPPPASARRCNPPLSCHPVVCGHAVVGRAVGADRDRHGCDDRRSDRKYRSAILRVAQCSFQCSSSGADWSIGSLTLRNVC